jgi:predicted site-specific integrase-resolvase
MARSNGENQEPESNIVTPVALSKELGIRPQIIFGWTRGGKLPVHFCVCGHQYLQRDEVATFLAEREAKQAEKEAKVAAELEASEAETAAA